MLEWDDNIPSFEEVHARSVEGDSISGVDRGFEIAGALVGEDAREGVHP